ncbi:Methyltransferase ausD [Hypsizygus marmoreus]|uniref:Methyltransferase ausD n=1 Tax=Hypsizygus marmoreus TaxID=39966 RepID=A0A369JNL6_HYPMA|nr:Methyltransferase ausD [Hypsizygus marmoreus]
MSANSIYADPLKNPPLTEEFYSLAEDEYQFFKSQTGIEEPEELKAHIIAVQKKAYEIYGYPCIRSFSFIKLKIARMPAYPSALKLSREREDAILLDIGCCFGNDARKAVVDGWPVRNVIASDLRKGFWDFGHELFKSTPETFPAAFVEGDAFDPAMIAPRAPFYEAPTTPRPDLAHLTSLTPLQGHVSAIHASSFFHLFGEERQLELARRVATLLSPLPGSVIFGAHGGLPQKGLRAENRGSDLVSMFCHSPESWGELWDGQIFDKGTVKVEAFLRKIMRPDISGVDAPDFFLIVWSMTRL